MKNKNIKILINELDRFILKFHLIKFLQSAFIGTALILLTFILLTTISYYTYPSPIWKKIILLFYIGILLWIFTEYFLLKAIPLWNKKHRLTYRKAAVLIIKLNPKFNDKLLSLLDFAETDEENPLIQASIKEKLASLKIWDIKNILTYKEAVKSLRILGLTIVFSIALFLINSDIILAGTKKIIHYNQYYQRPAPFKFHLLNKKLKVLQDSSYTIELMIKGRIIPENVFINIDGSMYLMPRKENSTDKFFYTIKNVQKDQIFFFSANGYNSVQYRLKVIEIPYIKNSTITVIPPHYTGLKKQKYQNATELNIPAFSTLKIDLKLKNTDSIKLIAPLYTITQKVNKNFASFLVGINNDQTLKIILYHNGSSTKKMQLKIKTNQDTPPYIQVEEIIDSLNYNMHFFTVEIKDDYGFSILKFYIKLNDTIINYRLPIQNDKEQVLHYGFNFDSLSKISPYLEYFFRICDNKTPAPNCTQSRIFHFNKPSHQEIANQLDSLNQLIEEKAETAKNLTQQLQQIAQDYRQKLLTENLDPWEKQEYAREVNQKTQELEDIIKQLRELNQQKQTILNSFSVIPEDTRQKAKLTDELLKELLNDDLKKLLKELNKILNNEQQTNLQDNTYYNQFNRKLNQTLDFLKRLAIEQKTLEQTQILKELAKEQDSLKKAIAKKQISREQAIQKQKEIKQNIKQQEQTYNQIQKENSQLKNPIKLKDLTSNFQNIQEMMQQNINLLNQDRRRKSQKLQNKIIDSISNLSQKMSQQLTQAQMQTNSIDIQKITKNVYRLEDLSKNIETLIITTNTLNYTNQSLDKLLVNIHDLENQFKPIADSLFRLGEKNIQIAKLLDSHLYSIEQNFKDIYKFVEKRKREKIFDTENNILDHTNIILLILTDIAQNLNKQLSNAMPSLSQQQKQQQGSGMKQLSQLQQMLEKQLQQLIQQAKQGKISSKEIAKSLVLKEKINFELNKLLNEYANSMEVARKLKEVKQINQMIDKQLTDKRLDNSLLQKANLLKVKLLEAENSIRTQNKKENKRIAQHNFKQYRTPKFVINQDNTKNKEGEKFLQNKIIRLDNFYYQIYKSYSLKK